MKVSSGELYIDPTTGQPIMPPKGNTLSTERERWQYRGYVYQLTNGEVVYDRLPGWYKPEWGQYFNEGMELGSQYQLSEYQKDLNKDTEKLRQDLNKQYLDVLRERQAEANEQFHKALQEGNVAYLSYLKGPLKPGQVYYKDPKTGHWRKGFAGAVPEGAEAITADGTPLEEGRKSVKEYVDSYNEIRDTLRKQVEEEVRQKQIDYLSRGVEWRPDPNYIENRVEELFNKFVPEEDRAKLGDALWYYGMGTPQRAPSRERNPYEPLYEDPDADIISGPVSSPPSTESEVVYTSGQAATPEPTVTQQTISMATEEDEIEPTESLINS